MPTERVGSVAVRAEGDGMRAMLLAVVTTAVALVGVQAPAHAADEIALGPATLELAPGGKVEATVSSRTTDPLDVRVEASVRGSGAEITFAVEPDRFTIAPGRSVAVTISAPASLKIGSTLRGEMRAFVDGRAITIPLVLSGATAPKPAVAKRTLVVQAWNPVLVSSPDDWRRVQGDALPVAGDPCATPPDALWASGGRTDVRVEPTCRADGTIGLIVGTFRTNAFADYAGTLESGGAKTEITVRYTTVIVWPVLTLLAGLAAALWAHGWVNGRRTFLLLRSRLLDIAATARLAQHTFSQQSEAAAGWRLYTIVPHVEAVVADAITELESLRDQSRAGLVQPGVVAQLEQLRTRSAPLETLVQEWSSAASRFRVLDQRRDAAADRDVWDLAPLLAQWADGLRRPSVANQTMTAEDWATDRAEIDLLPGATNLVGLVVYYRDELTAARRHLPDDHEEVAAADGRLAALTDRLRLAAHPESAGTPSKALALADEVAEFGDAVQRLPRPKALPADADEPAVDPREQRIAELKAMLATAGTNDARSTKQRLRTTDRGVTIIVCIVAVWSGIQTLYLGKPWGNVSDYVTALLWSFTATAVLPPVITALTQTTASRFRLATDD